MSKWYACVMYKEEIGQPPTMAVFVMPTTVDPPTLPKGGRLLGRVRSTRGEACDEAIDWFKAEKFVSDVEILKRSSR